MDKKVKNLIEELEGVVLELHSSVESLDNNIQVIDNMTEDDLNIFITAQTNYRGDFMKAYGKLEEEKNRILQEVIESLKI